MYLYLSIRRAVVINIEWLVAFMHLGFFFLLG
jgi:hypothetical protein